MFNHWNRNQDRTLGAYTRTRNEYQLPDEVCNTQPNGSRTARATISYTLLSIQSRLEKRIYDLDKLIAHYKRQLKLRDKVNIKQRPRLNECISQALETREQLVNKLKSVAKSINFHDVSKEV